MALQKICSIYQTSPTSFIIRDVTRTITVEEMGGVTLGTVNVGDTWQSKGAIAVGLYVDGCLIAGGASQALVKNTAGVWAYTDNTGTYQMNWSYIPAYNESYAFYANIPEATLSSISVTGNLVESVKVNNGTAQSVPYTFELNAGTNTMVIEGAPRLEQLAIEGDYDRVTYGSSSYPKPADITLDPATSVLTVVNPVKEITVKYTDTAEPTVTVTTTM
jgi:hypothetical protein